MNHNRKRREAERKERDAQRGRIGGEGASLNALPVDLAALRPSGSYSPPDFVNRGCYLDVPFTCIACGSAEVWTAAQQKWWYEVARGAIHSEANRCRPCRREAREYRGKAHPLHQLHRWILAIRDEIGPSLLADGWRGVAGVEESRPDLLSYERDGTVIRFPWWHGRTEGFSLVFERRHPGDHRFRGFSRPIFRRRPQELTHPELQRRLDAFLAEVRDELGLEPNPA